MFSLPDLVFSTVLMAHLKCHPFLSRYTLTSLFSLFFPRIVGMMDNLLLKLIRRMDLESHHAFGDENCLFDRCRPVWELYHYDVLRALTPSLLLLGRATLKRV